MNKTFHKSKYRSEFINKATVAIQINVYYEEILKKLIKRVIKIPIKYDLFISTISKEKKIFIEKYLQEANITKYKIKIYENKGRDVYPFIRQMKRHYKNCKYIYMIITI